MDSRINPLFPHAKSAEYPVQDVVGVNRADDLAEFFQHKPDFAGDEFFAGILSKQRPGEFKAVSGVIQRLSAPRRRAGNDLAAGIAE